MREKGGFRFKDPILDLPAHATLAIRGEISATEHQLIARKRPRSGKRTPTAAGQYQDHAQPAILLKHHFDINLAQGLVDPVRSPNAVQTRLGLWGGSRITNYWLALLIAARNEQ